MKMARAGKLGTTVIIGTALILSACQKAKKDIAPELAKPTSVVSTSVGKDYRSGSGMQLVKDSLHGTDLVSAQLADGKTAIGMFNKLKTVTDNGNRADTMELIAAGKNLQVPVSEIAKLAHATKGDIVTIRTGVATIVATYGGFAGGMVKKEGLKNEDANNIWTIKSEKDTIFVRKNISLTGVNIQVGIGRWFKVAALEIPITDIKGLEVSKVVHDKAAKPITF
ncbi:MAG: hypothetical protein NT051_03940 [Candidatus Micrarchaeota archaeon]|nr:hypothetical protein [Candidatus Micrarchaeota archaeon]